LRDILMNSVYLHKSRKKRLEQGHPWIFANEVERTEGEITPGELVSVYNHQGVFLAVGYINPASQILVRVVSYEPIEALDKNYFVERFGRCREHRERFLEDADSYRAVYGEADFLPGIVVDKFADFLVIQFLSLGMDVRRKEIIDALVEVFQPEGIYERSDVGVRELEGLSQQTGTLYGECPRHVKIMENGLFIEVDIKEGQKTGYFFDQRENRAAIASLMKGWGANSGITMKDMLVEGEVRHVPVNANDKLVTFPYWDGATVLECFAHTGSFTLNACKYGAKKVTCLDISELALDSAKKNVALNGFNDRVEFVAADAFDYLRDQVKGVQERKERGIPGKKKIDTSKRLTGEGLTWDVVILDPPAFAKSKSAVKGACRGYKDINLHAMKLVNEGGYLVTASCSYHVRQEVFLQTIQDAAVDAGKILRLVEYRGAGKDHPQILGANEGDYLKFAIFEVRGRL
jgi:23S rRNA (cytosine1962-C5)-methyltransferase